MHKLYELKRRDPKRRDYWESIVKEYSIGKLNRQTFCDIHGLKEKDLTRWNAKLRREKAKATTMSDAKSQPFEFVSLDVSDKSITGTNTHHEMVIQHPLGVRITLPVSVSKSVLNFVLQKMLPY